MQRKMTLHCHAKNFFMKTITQLLFVFFFISLSACTKDGIKQNTIAIPNGDFETWDINMQPASWVTNSCYQCVPPYESYIVRRESNAADGSYAATFIYNNVFPAVATNTFPLTTHPDLLTGRFKATLAASDSASVKIKLYSGGVVSDSGVYYQKLSFSSYQYIEIPISQNIANVDSARVTITGGKKSSSTFSADNLELVEFVQ
jgi:hypothetical protein